MRLDSTVLAVASSLPAGITCSRRCHVFGCQDTPYRALTAFAKASRLCTAPGVPAFSQEEDGTAMALSNASCSRIRDWLDGIGSLIMKWLHLEWIHNSDKQLQLVPVPPCFNQWVAMFSIRERVLDVYSVSLIRTRCRGSELQPHHTHTEAGLPDSETRNHCPQGKTPTARCLYGGSNDRGSELQLCKGPSSSSMLLPSQCSLHSRTRLPRYCVLDGSRSLRFEAIPCWSRLCGAGRPSGLISLPSSSGTASSKI